MKTTTVRLDDDMLRVIDEIAKADGCRTADVVRNSVRDFIAARASHDPKIADLLTTIAEQRIKDSADQIRDTFGTASLPDDKVLFSATKPTRSRG